MLEEGDEQENLVRQQQYVDALASIYGTNEVADDSENSSTLFVGDLSISCQEHHLIELFAGFINREYITSAHILRCRTTGTSLCYGFVKITSPNSEEDARLVRNELHGMYFLGRVLKLRNAKPPNANGGAGGQYGEQVTEDKVDENLYNYDLPKISIYVKFQCTHISNNNHVNEENIRQIFDLDSETKRIIYNESKALNDAESELDDNGERSGESVTRTDSESDTVAEQANPIVDITIRKLAVDRVS